MNATAADSVRTYLVVVDATPESRVALRYAALRARSVGGRVILLHVMPATEFMQWGGVQAAIEAEAAEAAQTLLAGIADEVVAWTGKRPGVIIAKGEAVAAVMDTVAADASIHALVLGAASKGAPGPLVSYFAGERAGTLPCLVMIVPGGVSEDRLAELT
ncbi:MAG TPA: universal stress protein [Polymorphobacter sp.]|nr:universal stress protein [Polymorphobacter sp.]